VDWIEQIPFSETRNYVQRVLESLSVYRLAHDASGSNGIWKASATAF
jgi:soluble lytic murein transglycosylase-like protein